MFLYFRVFTTNGPFRRKIKNGSERRIKLILGSDNFVIRSLLKLLFSGKNIRSRKISFITFKFSYYAVTVD